MDEDGEKILREGRRKYVVDVTFRFGGAAVPIFSACRVVFRETSQSKYEDIA